LGGEEDTEYFSRLLALGGTVVYQPSAVVHHTVPLERMELGYFRKWHFEHGAASALVTPCARGRGVCGIPFWAIRACLTELLGALRRCGSRDVERRLVHQMRVLYYLGLFSAKARMLGRRPQVSVGCDRASA
jgi:hypothetical protein